MNKNTNNGLFLPSGCLNLKGFALAASTTPGPEKDQVMEHLNGCSFCRDALEGYQMLDAVTFEEETSALIASLDELQPLHSPQNELQPGSAPAFEGRRFPRLSPEEIRQFTAQVHARSAAAQSPGDDEVATKGLLTLFRKYKPALVAAGLLLILTAGSWYLLSELTPTRINHELAVNKPAVSKTEHQKSGALSDKEALIQPQANEPAPKNNSALTENHHKQAPSPAPAASGTITVVDDDVIADELQIDAEATVLADTDISVAAETTSALTEQTSGQIQSPASSETKELTKQNQGIISRKTGKITRAEMNVEEEIAEAEIFTVVEETPQFPGGQDALMQYLAKNISYPARAVEAAVSGIVYVTFVVNADGTLGNIRVLRGIGSGCDEEAVRVIKQMPRWIPGKQRGKPVKVQFNLPIKFSLAG